MARVRAVVLAAGRGTRMGGTTPKTLVNVRAYEPLLHYILAGVKAAGADDLLVVTGHRPAEVQEFVTERWGGEVTFVFNARYASWGNFHTVRMAVDQSPGMRLLVVNSDIVAPPSVYRDVVASPGDLVLAVQRRDDLDDEDMRVRLRRDKVLGIGKDVKPAWSHGEFAGISLMEPEAAAVYADLATNLEWTAGTSLYYEDVYRTMLERMDVRAVLVPPGAYAELDEPRDLEHAAGVIKANLGEWEEPAPAAQTRTA